MEGFRNKAELDKIVAGKTDAWDAKIGVNDAAKLSYSHNNMGGATNVKAALDLLAEVDAQYVEYFDYDPYGTC